MIFDKESKAYWGSILVILICLSLIATLILVQIPEANKDIITLVVGAFVTGTVLAINNLTGNTDQEMKEMQERVEKAEQERNLYKERFNALQKELESVKEHLVQLQRDVISELSILAKK